MRLSTKVAIAAVVVLALVLLAGVLGYGSEGRRATWYWYLPVPVLMGLAAVLLRRRGQ